MTLDDLSNILYLYGIIRIMILLNVCDCDRQNHVFLFFRFIRFFYFLVLIKLCLFHLSEETRRKKILRLITPFPVVTLTRMFNVYAGRPRPATHRIGKLQCAVQGEPDRIQCSAG